MWEVSRALQVTGSVLNGTTPREASIQESIKESGKSNYPTAGSFVRPSRPSYLPLSFLEALRDKYASENDSELVWTSKPLGQASQQTIEISGKVVEEVGFDKIRKQLAELQELRIVLLDGLRIVGVLSSYEQPEAEVLEAAKDIATTCPKIEELDLSRSLLSRWRHVWDICYPLKELKKLKVNGNRFQPLEDGFIFEGITELHLEETLLSWDEIAEVTSRFPSLTSLTASGNQLRTISRPLPGSIKKLTLENNEVRSLLALGPLSEIQTLEHLSIRGNNIDAVTDSTQLTALDFTFPPTVTSVDLSRNNISSWTILNHLPILFPGLTTLRFSGNPLYDQPPLPPAIAAATSSMSASKPMTLDESFMLTLSRFPASLKTLNFSTISPQDRSNAEMYYLSLIGKELSATSEAEEPAILAAHPRYAELCELYGEPTVTRAVERDGSGKRVIHPRSVATRLIKLAFQLSESQVCVKEIPTSFDSYQVKALVSRLFHLAPYSFRLVWETDEWDPVEKKTGDDGVAGWDEDSDDEMQATAPVSSADTSRFVRREIELDDSTRDIGFLFQGETGEMKIRVEVPPV
ncbi:Tubulin-specific chaperone E [Penicillium subrubescens]|uniref:Tubulin-specific chaperone E n=1 Tax=Penicillium subrubescens TaxID=1316194 RepID=A0A1Q5UJU6_9EURO|nr:Tubulin-specific chaperone E [Penicillium subrubescens]